MEKTELTAADLARYIGCECRLYNGDGCLATILAINSGLKDWNPIGVRTSKECGNVDVWLTAKEVKPILRPLSDMTEEEEKEFVPLAAGSQIARFSRDNSGPSNWWQWFLEFENGDTDHLIINEQGETWFRSHFESAESRRNWSNTVNTHEQTIWLIRHWFDVFKWIPAGLAIDKTKL